MPLLWQLKTIARTVAPPPARKAWGRVYGGFKLRRARRAFDAAAADAGGFLPADELPRLMQRRFRPPDPVRYDPEGLTIRAQEKVARLSRVVDLDAVGTALELGCWDGLVAAELARRGVAVCGLDVSIRGVDRRAAAAGVRFLQSDAAAIALGHATIDFVYSFGSLEHFREPDRCLDETARVTKPGGLVYLEFGPLYFSPYGRHAYRQIPIPFCHLLFTEDVLRAWTRASGLPDDWPFVNGWPLARYRRLWEAVAPRFEVVKYAEHTTGGVGTELVVTHPALFRSRVSEFDELLVAGVEIVLRRR